MPEVCRPVGLGTLCNDKQLERPGTPRLSSDFYTLKMACTHPHTEMHTQRNKHVLKVILPTGPGVMEHVRSSWTL